jgi:twitching motility protein PilT
MASLDKYLEAAVAQGASDVHVSSNSQVYTRVLGILRAASPEVLAPQQVHDMITELLGPTLSEKLRQTLEIDTSYTLPNGERFRMNAFMEKMGLSLVARHFSKTIRTLEELGLPPVLNRFADAHQGLILITGPGRSGKSTTAAAIIDYINARRDDHIITIEDPIEYLHPKKKCLVNQRGVGPHTDTFASALRGALREDPDIIVVGELRDTETMALALSAAETGHLVIGTLNTNSAAATISRVINLFPSAERSQATTSLSETLVGIVSQRLLPTADGKALIPAFEVLVNTLAVANVIMSNEYHKLGSMLATGQKDGMVTLANYLKGMLDKGLVSKETVDTILAEEV